MLQKVRKTDGLTRWLDWQWNIAPPIQGDVTDPETGEVLTGRARWLETFRRAKAGELPGQNGSDPP